jgi:hypothetical protein
MTPKPFSVPCRLATSAYEAMIENAIVRPDDLYEIDRDTLLRCRDGRIETSDIDRPE